MFKKRPGITYIELLIILMIVGFIAVLSFSSYLSWQKEVTLVNAADELKSAIVLAQAQALSAAGNNNWGVHLEADSYTIFPGTFFNQDNPENKTKELRGVQILNPDTSLADGAGGFGANVVFAKYTGQTVNFGQIVLVANNDQSKTKTINIQNNGQIN